MSQRWQESSELQFGADLRESNSLQHTPLSTVAQRPALSPPRPINITSGQCELPVNEEKTLQQVPSISTKGVHPLIHLLDDLTILMDSGHPVGLSTQACCHAAASPWGRAARGRDKCQTGCANAAVVGDHGACQPKANLLRQRKNARLGEKSSKEKGVRKVL